MIATERIEGCVLEAGPDSYLAQKPWALHLIRELGLGDDVIGSNDHLRVTYVLKRGRLVPLPDGLMLMIPTRIFRGPHLAARLRNQGPHGPRVVPAAAQRLAARPLRGRVRRRALRLGSGGLSGRAAAVGRLRRRSGEAQRDECPAAVRRLERKYGSLTKGVLHERRKAAKQAQGPPLFQTLKGGLGQLIDALVAQTRPAPEVLHAPADAVERSTEGARWRVRMGGQWMAADHVVLACQAYQAGALLASRTATWRRCSTPSRIRTPSPSRWDTTRPASPPAQRLRLPGAQERAPAAGGLHLGRHQVLAPRAGGQSGSALLRRRRGPQRAGALR